MTDFTGIDDDELVPDAPITSLLGFRLRDNPIAMFEGALDAPGLQFRAIMAVSVGGVAKLWRGPTVNGAPGVDILSAVLFNSGTLRAGATFWTGSNFDTAQALFVRTRGAVETVVATVGGINNSGVTLSADIPFSPHDRISIRVNRTGIDVSAAFFRTSGGDLWILDKTPQAELLNMSRGS